MSAWGHRSACLAVPREIKDQATGEVLDVVQDDDPDLPPEPNLQEPGDPEPVA